MSDRGRLLIVNADDFGRTAGINSGVLEAHRGGIVTSATLMVGFPAAAEVADRLAEHRELGVGLHVTLTGGTPPLLPAGEVPSLVDDAGRLPREPSGLAGAEPDDVSSEIREQVRVFRELTGRPPTHLDGHHHCHRLPVVLDAVIEIAGELGLPVRAASPKVGERLRAAGIPTTDAFLASFYGEEATLTGLLQLMEAAGEGVTEIMCHPGRADDELRRDSSYVEEREREIEVLTHPEVAAAVRDLGLRLAHFGTAWTS